MTDLHNELKNKIIANLQLDLAPEELGDDAPFFGGGFNLDSVDILEMVIFLEADYGVRIESRELGEKVFVNLDSLARYVAENRSR